MSSTSVKSSRNSVSIQVKINALNEIKKGISKELIAKDLNVHVTTVYLWIKNEEKLRKFYEDRLLTMHQKKRMVLPVNYHADIALWIWFVQHRAAGFPISGNILQIQALNFWKLFGGSQTFVASSGWLSKWKARHQVKNVAICGEKLSSDVAGAEEYKKIFADKINDEFTPHQIFNCDETGLNWRQMPRKTLNASHVTSAAGFKLQKERVTVMACSNAAGSSKLPLVVIGKSANPRATKNIKKNLPVTYYNQSSAWMTTGIYKEWFTNHFVPEVSAFLKSKGLPPKAILYMDNCAAHPDNMKVGEISVEFLPPNTTALIQPMDQGCLQNLKSIYRLHMMTFMMESFNKGEDLPTAVKKITIREVIHWLSQSWDSVLRSTIIKSWKPLWPDVEKVVEVVDFCEDFIKNNNSCLNEANVDNLIQQFHHHIKQDDRYKDIEISTVNDWANCAQALTEDEILDDNEIVQCLLENEARPELDDNVEPEDSGTHYQKETNEAVVKATKVLDQVHMIMEHCDKSPHYTQLHLFYLNEIKKAVNSEIFMSQPFVL